MSSYILNLFNTGQVTLPKKWRENYDTKKFIAKESPEWLIIQPLFDNDDSVFYENSEGFGIYSESWIDPDQIISKIKKLQNG